MFNVKFYFIFVAYQYTEILLYKMTRNYKHLVKGHEPMLYGTLNGCGSSLKFYNCKLERTLINYQTTKKSNILTNMQYNT